MQLPCCQGSTLESFHFTPGEGGGRTALSPHTFLLYSPPSSPSFPRRRPFVPPCPHPTPVLATEPRRVLTGPHSSPQRPPNFSPTRLPYAAPPLSPTQLRKVGQRRLHRDTHQQWQTGRLCRPTDAQAHAPSQKPRLLTSCPLLGPGRLLLRPHRAVFAPSRDSPGPSVHCGALAPTRGRKRDVAAGWTACLGTELQ